MTAGETTSRGTLRALRLGEATILAVSPIFAYTMAFCYEAGYAQHFGYPTYLIEVDLRTTLFAWLILFPVLASLATVVFGAVFLVPSKGHRLMWYQALVMGPMVVTLALCLWARSVNPGQTLATAWVWASIAGIVLHLVLVGVVGWRSRSDGLGSLVDRLVAVEESLYPSHDAATRVRWRAINTVRVLVTITGVLIATVAFGRWSARRQGDFLVRGAHQDLAVVRRYGDMLIAAPFDSTSGTIGCQYHILPVVDAAGPPWELRHLALSRAGKDCPSSEGANTVRVH